MSVSGFLRGLVQILSHYCLILFSACLVISVRECVLVCVCVCTLGVFPCVLCLSAVAVL